MQQRGEGKKDEAEEGRGGIAVDEETGQAPEIEAFLDEAERVGKARIARLKTAPASRRRLRTIAGFGRRVHRC